MSGLDASEIEISRLGVRRRSLYVIPIVHSQQDMGNLGQRLPAEQARAQSTMDGWLRIQNAVRSLPLIWSQAKVYQDGLPDTDFQIIRKILEEVQSPNYDLLRWLVAQGAQIVGTESPTLLKEEYDYLRAVLTASDASSVHSARQTTSRDPSPCLPSAMLSSLAGLAIRCRPDKSVYSLSDKPIASTYTCRPTY